MQKQSSPFQSSKSREHWVLEGTPSKERVEGGKERWTPLHFWKWYGQHLPAPQSHWGTIPSHTRYAGLLHQLPQNSQPLALWRDKQRHK